MSTPASPRRSSFLETVTLRFRLSWTRWCRRRLQRRLELRALLALELHQLEQLRHPLLVTEPQPEPEPPRTVAVRPEPQPLSPVRVSRPMLVQEPLEQPLLLTPQHPTLETEPEPEPEEMPVPAAVEISQLLGLSTSPPSSPSSES